MAQIGEYNGKRFVVGSAWVEYEGLDDVFAIYAYSPQNQHGCQHKVYLAHFHAHEHVKAQALVNSLNSK